MQKAQPQVLQYRDHLQFLKDYFEYKKSCEPLFQISNVTRIITGSSKPSGILQLILSGKRKISNQLRVNILGYLQLPPSSSVYLDLLIQHNQAKDERSKSSLKTQLSKLMKRPEKEITDSEYNFFSHWVNPLVWTFFGIEDKIRDPSTIQKRLLPPLTIDQIKRAISHLLGIKFIKKTANGYTVTEKHLKTKDLFKSENAVRYHKEMLSLSELMLDSLPPEERDFSVLLFSIKQGKIPELFKRVQAFKDELKCLGDEGDNSDSDALYSLNFQLYPVSKQK